MSYAGFSDGFIRGMADGIERRKLSAKEGAARLRRIRIMELNKAAMAAAEEVRGAVMKQQMKRRKMPWYAPVALPSGVTATADPPDDAYTKQRIADLERCAEAEGNVLYIWEAILYGLNSGIPLSPLCLAEIKAVAMRLHCLMHDVSVVVARKTNETEGAYAARCLSTFENAPPNKKALDYVGAALGITGGNHRNAFAALAKNMEDIRVAALADALLSAPAKHKETIDNALRAAVPNDHERSLSKARGRKLARTPPPPKGRPRIKK